MWYTSTTLSDKKNSRGIKSDAKRTSRIPNLIMNSALTKTQVQTPSIPRRLSEHLDSLDSFTNPDRLAEFALDAMLAVVGAGSGSFFAWDEFQKELILKKVRGRYHMIQLARPHIKLREGILGLVGEQGTSVLVKDIHEDTRFQSLKRCGQYRTSSFMAIPLIIRHKLIGVINITEREDLSPFSEEDFERAQILADSIAFFLGQARLIDRLQQENNELHQQVTSVSQNTKDQEALIAVGKLSTNLAHELNNPLDAIRRYVNLALDQVMEDSLAREYLLKAKKGIRQAVHVIRGLLHYSRNLHQTTEPRTAEIHSLIAASLDHVAHHPNFQQIRIEKKFGAQTSYVMDRGLPLVFQNLYQNACQAMDGHGILSISTFRQNGTVSVSVAETGAGIAEGNVPHLFEPFFTTKHHLGGTGIGLALCREIVEKCGGSIMYKNNEQQGANFVITLPCIDPAS